MAPTEFKDYKHYYVIIIAGLYAAEGAHTHTNIHITLSIFFELTIAHRAPYTCLLSPAKRAILCRGAGTQDVGEAISNKQMPSIRRSNGGAAVVAVCHATVSR